MVRVSAVRKPERCVPPSTVLMLFAKREDGLRVGVVVLERDLHDERALLGFHVDGLFVQHLLALVEVLDEPGDAVVVLEALAFEFAGLGVGSALVGEGDLDPLVQEGELAEALRERVVVVLGDGEDGAIGKEMDLGAEALGRAHLAQLADRRAFRVILLPGVAVAPDLDVELFRERVHAGDADAVQTTRDLVVGGVELTAGVQHSEHDLNSGHGLASRQGFVVDRDTPAIVDDGDGVVGMDRDVDLCRVAGERLIDGIVDDLINQMMQALLARGADVHGRTKAHGGESFEHRDVFAGVVSGGRRRGGRGGCGGDVFRHAVRAPVRPGTEALGALANPCEYRGFCNLSRTESIPCRSPFLGLSASALRCSWRIPAEANSWRIFSAS